MLRLLRRTGLVEGRVAKSVGCIVHGGKMKGALEDQKLDFGAEDLDRDRNWSWRREMPKDDTRLGVSPEGAV